MSYTNNPFALTLLYYDNYKRSMLLSEAGLLKIAAKYEKKSASLLPDLHGKYRYPLPETVSYQYLAKIFSTYSIPPSYRLLCGASIVEISDYQEKYDVSSENFDADSALRDKVTFSQFPDAPAMDNMSRVTNNLESLIGRSSEESTAKVSRKRPANKEVKIKELPILKQIADYALKNKDNPRDPGPLVMLQRCMESGSRVQVIIRRRKRVHGILRGYLKGFDKHWNLLLQDVDEEYVQKSSTKKTNSQKIILCKDSQAIQGQLGCQRRHLPQLFVRGDNIVLINRSFSESSTSSSAKDSSMQQHVQLDVMSDEILVDYDGSSNF